MRQSLVVEREYEVVRKWYYTNLLLRDVFSVPLFRLGNRNFKQRDPEGMNSLVYMSGWGMKSERGKEGSWNWVWYRVGMIGNNRKRGEVAKELRGKGRAFAGRAGA